MRLSQRELVFIKNNLLARRAYRRTEAPLNPLVWEPWMETLLTKVTDELEVLTDSL